MITIVAQYGAPMSSLKGAPVEAAIIMRQHGLDRFSVQYGLQKKFGLSYDKAALEFGVCVMHYEACEGRLDDRMPGEE